MPKFRVGDRFKARSEEEDPEIRGKTGIVTQLPTSGIRLGDAMRTYLLIYEVRLDGESWSRNITENNMEFEFTPESPSVEVIQNVPEGPIRKWLRRILAALGIR